MVRKFIDRIAFATLYFGAASASVAFTRFDGGVAFIWLGTAILAAKLLSTRGDRSWLSLIGLAYVANLAASGLFGAGWLAGPFISLVNVGEGVLAAWLLQRCRYDQLSSLTSLEQLGSYLLAVGIIAPIVVAPAGSAVLSIAFDQPWLSNAVHWVVGHALSNITFTPMFKLLFSGELVDWLRHNRQRRLFELLGALSAVTVSCVLAFGQSRAPILFLPLIVIILATLRLGRVGAALSVAILTILGGAYTIHGGTPLDLIPSMVGLKIQFLQVYLAAVVLCVLPVAAELEHRTRLFKALHASEASYRLVAENSSDIIMRTDTEGRILFVSAAVRRLGGPGLGELIGRPAIELVHPDHAAHVRLEHRLALQKRSGNTRFEFEALAAGSTPRWCEATMQCLLDDEGMPAGAVSIIRDITERKALEDQLFEAALTDSLTGLANRRAFMAALDGLADGNAYGCLALFDMDHFKSINDRFGHEAGDRVLRTFADLARAEVREHDLVARIGGEEFAILLPRTNGEHAAKVCQRILDRLAREMIFSAGGRINVTASAGIAEIGEIAEQALKRADDALYAAKAGGRDQLKLVA